jgi:hypothetical protein
MMPMFWPSSRGKCTPPKSSTMWRMSALALVAGEAEVAGHRGADRPLLAVEIDRRLLRRPRRGDRAALAGGGLAGEARHVLRFGRGGRHRRRGAGSSSQEYCSSSVYGLPGAMGNQLSMAPVGQGGTQARQSLQMAAFTT